MTDCTALTTSATCTATAVSKECVWKKETTEATESKCFPVPPPAAPVECNTLLTSSTCKGNTRCFVAAQEACIKTPTEVNWDKEIVIKQGWYDKTLFSLFGGKLRVTVGMSVGIVVAIVVIALLVSAVLSYLAYRKREVIAD